MPDCKHVIPPAMECVDFKSCEFRLSNVRDKIQDNTSSNETMKHICGIIRLARL